MSLTPYTRDSRRELQNKTNSLQLEIEALQLDEDGFVTVGTGGTYASIQEAINAGGRQLLVVSDLTLTEDVVSPDPDGISLHIVIEGSNTVTFSNASIPAGENILNTTLEGRTPLPIVTDEFTLPPEYGANVVINFTDPAYSGTGVLDNMDSCAVRNLNVTDNSTVGNAGLVIGSIYVEISHVYYTLLEPIPRTLGGFESAVLRMEKTIMEVENASSVQAFSSLVAYVRELFITTASGSMGGGASVRTTGDAFFDMCSFYGVTLVVLGSLSSAVNCLFSDSLVEGTAGSGNLNRTAFLTSCFVEPPYDWEISSTGGSIQGGYIDPLSLTTQVLTLSGTRVSLNNVAITMDDVTISGTECAMIGCVGSDNNNSPDFVVSVTGAATDTRLVGNGFTGAVVDAGFNTQNVANTT